MTGDHTTHKRSSAIVLAVITVFLVTWADAQTTLIDDFEDAGLGRPDDIQNELSGYWFTYDDRKNNGGSSVAHGPAFVSPGASSSAYCVHFSYTLGSDYRHRFAGLATNLGPHTPSGKMLTDLSDVTALSLSLKGSGHELFINLQSPVNTDNNFHCYKVECTPSQWQDVTIRIPQDLEAQWGSTLPWDSVKHAITAIQFKAASKQTGEQGEVWVDDIVLHGTITQAPVRIVEPSPADMGTVFACDFEHRSPGPYDYLAMAEDWNEPDFSNGVVDGRCEIVGDPQYGRSLKVTYPANGVGPHEGGAQWITYFKNDEGMGVSYDELYASYVVKLPVDFEPVKGGKLPGLGGGTAPTGGVPVDGTRGFSARQMWRRLSSGADGNHIYLTSYMYYLDKASEWGRDLWWNSPPTDGWCESFDDWSPEAKVYLTPGTWDTLSIKVKINTPGAADGEMLAWLNGQPVLNNRAIRYRADGAESFKVGLFYFSTFFGGSTDDWAPSSDQYILFDDFRVSTEPFDFLQSMPATGVEAARSTRSEEIIPHRGLALRGGVNGGMAAGVPPYRGNCVLSDLRGRRLTVGDGIPRRSRGDACGVIVRDVRAIE